MSKVKVKTDTHYFCPACKNVLSFKLDDSVNDGKTGFLRCNREFCKPDYPDDPWGKPCPLAHVKYALPTAELEVIE